MNWDLEFLLIMMRKLLVTRQLMEFWTFSNVQYASKFLINPAVCETAGTSSARNVLNGMAASKNQLTAPSVGIIY
jgi:hypothetical protein